MLTPKLALKEPNFIGKNEDVFYFILNERSVTNINWKTIPYMLMGSQYYEKLIPGEYAIIYTRPVGENFGSTSKSALIDPNMSKCWDQVIWIPDSFWKLAEKLTPFRIAGGNTIEVFRDIDQAREHGSEPLVAFIGQLMHDHQNEKEPYTCVSVRYILYNKIISRNQQCFTDNQITRLDRSNPVVGLPISPFELPQKHRSNHIKLRWICILIQWI